MFRSFEFWSLGIVSNFGFRASYFGTINQVFAIKWRCSTKKLSQNTICHSERSEESLISASQTLRFAQGDSFEIVSKTSSCIIALAEKLSTEILQITRLRALTK